MKISFNLNVRTCSFLTSTVVFHNEKMTSQLAFGEKTEIWSRKLRVFLTGPSLYVFFSIQKDFDEAFLLIFSLFGFEASLSSKDVWS